MAPGTTVGASQWLADRTAGLKAPAWEGVSSLGDDGSP